MRWLQIGLIGMLISGSSFAANIKKQKSNFSTTYDISMTEEEQVHLREKGVLVSIDQISDSRCPEGKVCWDLWPGAIVFNMSLINLESKMVKNMEIFYQDKAVEISSDLIMTNVIKEGNEYRLEIEFKH